MPLSDDDILRRVQSGERAAYLELFDRYYPRLERYALRQLHNAEAARDAASETFLRAYRSVDSFRIGEHISYAGYLFLVCRRLVLTEWQKRRAAPLVPMETLWEDFGSERPAEDESGMPLAHVLNGEKRAMVQDALQQLSPDDQEIILLAFERDLSRKDIAEILHKPSVSAVTSHLHRAMQKLKGHLIRQGYFYGAEAAEWERR